LISSPKFRSVNYTGTDPDLKAFVQTITGLIIMKFDALKKLFLFLLLAGITIILDSCSSFLRTQYDVSDLKIEKKLNGYLLKFTANKRIEDMEAFVSQSNWLIVTIANASIDSVKIESVKPSGIIEKIETENFGPSVQVSLKLSENVEKVEVVRDPETYDMYVNLIPASGN
jgi:hypothetical protein